MSFISSKYTHTHTVKQSAVYKVSQLTVRPFPCSKKHTHTLKSFSVCLSSVQREYLHQEKKERRKVLSSFRAQTSHLSAERHFSGRGVRNRETLSGRLRRAHLHPRLPYGHFVAALLPRQVSSCPIEPSTCTTLKGCGAETRSPVSLLTSHSPYFGHPYSAIMGSRVAGQSYITAIG